MGRSPRRVRCRGLALTHSLLGPRLVGTKQAMLVTSTWLAGRVLGTKHVVHYLVAVCAGSFAVGWWVGGETSFQKWHRAEFNELANRKRRALKYMKEHREQFEDKIPVRSQPQMSPAAPSKGVVLPNVEATSPLP